MKLLIERFDDVEVLVEGTGSDKQLYIHGIHAQAEMVNRNKRNYAKSVLENAINKYNKDYVLTNRALGELNHPARMSVDPEHVSHRICELKWSGNDVIGKSLILNTPKGNIIKGLLEGGTKLGVSTRGAGTVTLREGVSHVGNDFVLSTIDAVLDPSGISCWVDPIMESNDWVFEAGTWKIQEHIEDTQNIIKSLTMKELSEQNIMLFKNFMDKLSKIS